MIALRRTFPALVPPVRTARAGVREDELQAAIVDGLQVIGFTVLQTNLAKSRVIADKGVPDLLVRGDGWPPGALLGLELKRERGRWSSTEQRVLWQSGATARATSIEEACLAIFAYCKGIGAELRPEVLRLARRVDPARRGEVVCLG